MLLFGIIPLSVTMVLTKQKRQLVNTHGICTNMSSLSEKQKYGLFPPKLAEATPWDKLCVNLVGPYKIRRKGTQDLIYAGVSL
jgi:hypothetical protein